MHFSPNHPTVRRLQYAAAMISQDVMQAASMRHDGFGFRRFEEDDNWGRVELLELGPTLSTPKAEQAIRARAARFINCQVPIVAPLYSIARGEDGVSIVSGAPDGLTLADLLGALEFGVATLNDGAVLELAAMTVRAVASMHEMAGTFAHSALTPSHVLLRTDGTVLLTGAVFGDALQALQKNREQLWREFGIALPPSASLPRFDHRSDVTQLGALVLAILLRRALTADEYPRAVHDLVHTATDRLSIGSKSSIALRLWLQQTLQLQSRALFSSAVDAERAYVSLISAVSDRRAGAVTIQETIRHLAGEETLADESAPARGAAPEAHGSTSEAAAPPSPAPVPIAARVRAGSSAQDADSRRGGFTRLRSMLPNFRPN
jgi:hypothetical protein